MTLELCPLTLKEARSYVAAHHRHNGPPHAWKFGVAVVDRRSERGGGHRCGGSRRQPGGESHE